MPSVGARTVLVVDDNEDNREVVAMVLGLAGYRTVAATDGAHALSILSTTRPCTIVLDLAMPVMDGWEFRRKQLARSELRSIPVVLYSANPDLEQHAQALGAVEFIKKPVDTERLLKAVKAACEG